MKSILLVVVSCFIALTPALAADCNAVGERVATQQAGQLSHVELQSKDGRPICVVVVIVPARKGEKPRRVEVAVPAN